MQQLDEQLWSDCQAFLDKIAQINDEQFRQPVGAKWSVADVTQHLYLSARPVVRLMTGPREQLRQWGEPAVPSRSYDELNTMYKRALANGVKAPAAMSPRPEDMQGSRAALVDRFVNTYRALIDAYKEWQDVEMDQYTIPHPALGKLTVREMLLFTSIHTRHHLNRL